MISRWVERQEDDFRDFKKDNLFSFLPEFLRRVPKDAAVLDIGCGNGYFLEFLQREGYLDVVGIDVVQKAVEETRGRGIIASLTDGHATDYEDNSFDAVCASHVLEHSPVPRAFVREMVRITKGDGLIFIEVPTGELPGSHSIGHFSFFRDAADVKGLLELEGMEIIYERMGVSSTYKDRYVVIGKVKKI